MSDNEASATPLLPPRIFLLIENPKKSNNLGPILRCAAAFAVTQVILVGYDKCNTEGSHGASKHVDIVAFPVWNQAVAYLRRSINDENGGCNCETLMGLLCVGAAGAYSPAGYPSAHNIQHDSIRVVGPLEENNTPSSRSAALPLSYPVHTKPFLSQSSSGNYCVVLSKSNKGLPMELAAHCDFFVHVPHVAIPPVGGQPVDLPLDVPSCLSITLHHLTQWAGYHERVFHGHKFQVANVQRGRLPTFQSRAKDRQEHKHENELAAEMAIEAPGALASVFYNETCDYDY
ncbi:hypothetical protein MHU86_24455 [Fragilaria crotonensis]|nr:hypothetical protein MHU86_24455 [Fragilaria crotonensis]